MNVEIECGDLLIFSRPCLNMDPTSAVICLASKQTSFSPYDHVGIVVESFQEEGNQIYPPGTLYLLEANMGGVTLHKLDERLLRTKSTTIAARKLIGPKPDSFKELLWEEALRVSSKKYNPSFLSMTGALLWSYAAHGLSHSAAISVVTRLERTMREIEREVQVISIYNQLPLLVV